MKCIPEGVLRVFILRMRQKHMADFDQALLETLVNKYEADRPCQYQLQCLLTGRCPNDPVCNN